MGRLVTAVVALALIPWTARAQTSIEGDLYLLTQSGDVRAGAANEVALIPRVAAVAERWSALCREQDETFQALNAQLDARLAATPRADQLRVGQANLAELLAAARRHGDERDILIRSMAVARAGTGMQAHFRMEAPPGSYWLFAKMNLGEVPYVWFVPVVMRDGESIRLDLDNNNLRPAPPPSPGQPRLPDGRPLGCDDPFPSL